MTIPPDKPIRQHLGVLFIACIMTIPVGAETLAEEKHQNHTTNTALLLEHMEYQRNHRDPDAFNIDGDAWYGTPTNKLWLRFDGTRQHHQPATDMRTEALWQHSLSARWNSRLGIRHDHHDGPDRTWVAMGPEGPHHGAVDTQITVYANAHGVVAARLELDRDIKLTQQLILQPELDTSFYNKSDRRHDIGRGVAQTEIGLRLRYQLQRHFAPYFGIVLERLWGKTGHYQRRQGNRVHSHQLVIGFRAHF